MIKQIIVSMRPRQWTKNLFIFAAVLFTGQLTDLSLLMKSSLAFIIFCGLSATVYIINDIMDKEADKSHPRKKNRPIACGDLQPGPALAAAILIGLVSVALSLSLPFNFVFSALIYLALLIAYSLLLKQIIIIDTIVVSLGFVLRLLAGGFAIGVFSSPWSLIMTFFLALFMSFVKRRAEKDNLRYAKKETLDYIIIITATGVIISYTLFAFFSGKNANLYMTIPFVLYGVFRYIYLLFEKDLGADPSVLFIQDRPLFLTIAGWTMASAAIIYFL